MENQQAVAEQLFGEALDLPREERAAFLARACRDKPAVRQVVEALLEENDRLSGFLSDSPYKKAETLAANSPAGCATGAIHHHRSAWLRWNGRRLSRPR